MDSTAVTSLLPALLEKSLTVTILTLLLAAALWAIYKLWQRGNTKDTAHAAELAAINTLRLEETKEYAQRSKESSEHLRSMVDMQNRLLTSIEQGGKAEEKNRDLLAAMAEKMGISLKDFM